MTSRRNMSCCCRSRARCHIRKRAVCTSKGTRLSTPQRLPALMVETGHAVQRAVAKTMGGLEVVLVERALGNGSIR